MSRSLIWRAEEANLNAWPALQNTVYGDWLLRLSSGLSRRANSISPIREVAESPLPHLDALLALYASNGLPLIARLPNFLNPEIERSFDQAGFSPEGETVCIYGNLSDVAIEIEPRGTLLAEASPEWRNAFNHFHGRSPKDANLHGRIIDLIAVPKAFVMSKLGDEIVSVAYGAIHDQLLCVESVVTASSHYGKGYAYNMLKVLHGWGQSQGAIGVCLQVEASNDAGRALYDKLGLRIELSRYHYRRQRA